MSKLTKAAAISAICSIFIIMVVIGGLYVIHINPFLKIFLSTILLFLLFGVIAHISKENGS